jgi:hypothetical protein
MFSVWVCLTPFYSLFVPAHLLCAFAATAGAAANAADGQQLQLQLRQQPATTHHHFLCFCVGWLAGTKRGTELPAHKHRPGQEGGYKGANRQLTTPHKSHDSGELITKPRPETVDTQQRYLGGYLLRLLTPPPAQQAAAAHTHSPPRKQKQHPDMRSPTQA